MTGRERRDVIWENAIAQRADEAARSRDVALSSLTEHVAAAADIARARADEQDTRDIGARIGEILTAIRVDVDTVLAQVEAAVRRTP